MQEQVQTLNSNSKSSSKSSRKIVSLVTFALNDYVDVCDSNGQWKAGLILQKDEKKFNYKIRIDGNNSKHDQILKFDSKKLACFRSQTLGYTGPKNLIPIRQHFNFIYEQNDKQYRQIVDLIHKNIQEYDAYQITQFLRGKHYFYYEFLLNYCYEEVQSLSQALQYLKLGFSLVVKLIQEYPKNYLKSVDQMDIEIERQNLFLSAYYQIFDNIINLCNTNKNLRNQFILQNYQMLVESMPAAFTEECSELNCRLIFKDHVQTIGLVNKVCTFIKFLEQKKSEIPFEFITQFTNFYIAVDNVFIFPKNTIQSVYEIFKSKLSDYIKCDVKWIEKISIFECMKNLKKALCKKDQNYQKYMTNLQKSEIFLGYKYFRSSTFEKRIKGIQYLKQILEKLLKNNKQYKYIETNNFFNWAMTQSHFIKELLSDNHQEVVKKSIDIIKLFTISNIINQKLIDLIWQSRAGKHESILKMMNSMIIEIANNLKKQELIQYIFAKIKTTKTQKWDKDYFELVKSLCIQSQIFAQEYQGVDLLYKYWLFTKDETKLDAFLLILAGKDVQIVKKMMILSIDNIKKNQNLLAHVKLLLSLLNLPKLPLLPPPYTDHFILSIMLNHLCQNKYLPQQLSPLLNLIQKLLNQYLKTKITNQEMKKLWDKLKLVPEDHQKLLKWLVDNGKICPKKFLTVLNKEYIYYYLFYKQINPTKLSITEYKTFEIFFKDNYKLKKSQKGKKSQVVTLNIEIRKIIWDILLQNKNQSIQHAAMLLICDIHYCVVQECTRKITYQIFINYLIQQINIYNQKNQYEQLQLILQLIEKFIAKTQGRYLIVPPVLKSPLMKQITLIKISQFENFKIQEMRKKNSSQQKININVHLPIGMIKNQIANKLNILPICLSLYYGQLVIIPSDFDNKQFSSLQTYNQLCYFIDLKKIDNNFKIQLGKHFIFLYSILGLGQIRITKTVYNLIRNLNKSEQHIKQIADKPFENLMKKGIYHQIYILEIVQKSMKESWWEQQINANNIYTIISLLETPITADSCTQKYIKLVTSIIFQYICHCRGTLLDQQIIVIKIIARLFDFVNYLKNKSQQNFENLIEQELEILKCFFSIIYKLDCVTLLFTQYDIKLLIGTLLFCKNSLISKKVHSEFIKIITDTKYTQFSLEINKYMCIQLFNANKTQVHCYGYLQFLVDLISNMQIVHLKQLLLAESTLNLITFYFTILKKQKESKQITNQISLGLIYLLESIFRKADTTNILISKQLKNQIFKYLTQEYLFNFGQVQKSIQKSPLKIYAFKLLYFLIKNQQENILSILHFFNPLQESNLRRSNEQSDWNISFEKQLSPVNGYVGIHNIGTICYINSFLQQIFMIPSFYSKVISCQDPLSQKLPQSQNLLLQLKTVFLSLKNCEKTYDPTKFCLALKNQDGNPINIRQQMDTYEFFSRLFQNIQKQIKGTADENFIKDHFQGTFSNQIISKDCPHFSRRQESILSICLQVKNKKNITQSLEALVKEQILQGQNAYQCDQCQKKVSAIKRTCVNKLPNHLLIVLKRFQFDFDTMNKIKVNDYFQFPENLNLLPFSQQGLGFPDNLINHPQQYYQFQLKGVIVHNGFADGGHYYSIIQERTGQKNWYLFNDDIVKGFPRQRLQEEAFGGLNLQTGQQQIHNAYVLLYERKNFEKKPQLLIEQKVDCTIVQNIKTEKDDHRYKKFLFSQDYQQLMRQLLQIFKDKFEIVDYSLVKFFFKYCFFINIRSKSKQLSFQFLKLCKDKIINNREICLWILSFFTNKNYIFEFFVQNPIQNVRKLLSRLLKDILLKTIASQNFSDKKSQEYIYSIKFINTLMKVLFQEYVFLALDTNQIFYILNIQSKQIIRHMLEKHTLGRIISLINNAKLVDYCDLSELELNDIQTDIIVSETEIDCRTQIKDWEQIQRYYFPYYFNLLIKNCKLYEEANSYTQSLNYELEEKEKILFSKMNKLAIKELLDGIKSKSAIMEMCKVFKKFAYKNLEFTNLIFEVIQQTLSSQVSTNMSISFIIYKHLLNIKDDYYYNRIRGIHNIMQALDRNKKFIDESYVMIQWIAKLGNQYKQLQQQLRNNPNYIQIMFDCLFNIKFEINQLSDSEIKQISTHQSIVVNKRYSINIKISESVIRQLDQWLEEKANQNLNEIIENSEDEEVYKNFVVGDKVQVYNQQTTKFQKGVVKQVFYDLLTIETDKKLDDYWIDTQYVVLDNEKFRKKYQFVKKISHIYNSEIQTKQQNISANNTNKINSQTL